jgi:hypothetical protein
MGVVGKPSTAHEYDKSGQCIHCQMHKHMVEKMSHVCTMAREKLVKNGK